MKNKVVLIVAVLFGLLAAFLTRTYLSTKTDEFKKLTDPETGSWRGYRTTNWKTVRLPRRAKPRFPR